MDVMAPWEVWVRGTWLHMAVTSNQWNWPVLESLHFIGLSFLIGTVGFYDLRLIGLFKPVPGAALHRLIPLGIAGYCLNVLTGICFFFGFPEQYFYNDAFRTKLAFMALAGTNVVLFYAHAFRRVKHLGPGETAPLRARVIAAVSLTSWLGVLVCGRLLTFFRPPFFH
jgi:hypothetical protein